MTNSQRCGSLYLNDAGFPTCDLLYYFNGNAWTNSPLSTAALITPTSYLNQTTPVYYLNGKYWAFAPNGFSALLYSSVSGTFLSSLTFSSSPNLTINNGAGTAPFRQISLRSDGKGLAAIGTSSIISSIQMFTSSDSGSTWTSAPSQALSLVKIGSFGGSFYLLASVSTSQAASLLYKSDTGTSWKNITPVF